MAQANRVLIRNGDAVIATCIAFDRPREYWVAFREPAFAQKHAQQLWATCAHLGRWDWLTRIRFVPIESGNLQNVSTPAFDLAYQWMSFGMQDRQAQAVAELRHVLRPGGCAFVTGPASLRDSWKGARLTMVWEEPVEQLPTFRMHRTILPKARLNDGLTLFFVRAG